MKTSATISLPTLHRRFADENAFAPETLSPTPLNFKKLDGDPRYAVSNLAGEILVVDRPTLQALASGKISRSHPQYEAFRSRHFLIDGRTSAAVDLLALKYRTKRAYVEDFTGLHIFVATLRCDHSCPYCQVSRVSEDRSTYDMSSEVAESALGLVFQSPSPTIKIEFQGGESLLNFPLIREVVEKAEDRNKSEQRDLEFVIATNLSPVTQEMLDYCKDHRILISTSLDGPAELHNANRPRPEKDSYQRAIRGINLARETLGHDRVSALLTTTRATLSQPKAVIDEYIRQGFDGIFLRWLSPYGFAVKSQKRIGYPTRDFLDFYSQGLEYILELNRQGLPFREEYTALAIERLLGSWGTGYVDLMSPAGLGISAVVYNYDGTVHASDESRMLSEQGDDTFCLGTVDQTHEELFCSERLTELLRDTMVECTPQCDTCPYQTICGTDPVFHHATQGDLVGHRPTSAFCQRNTFVFEKVLSILADRPEDRDTILGWIRRG